MLSGIGGIGKTQIAIEYAYRHRHHFNPVFWINARDMHSAQTGYLQFAQRLVHHYADRTSLSFTQIANYLGLDGLLNEHGDIKLGERPPKLIIDAMKEWLGRKQNAHWLLIIDAMDELTSSNVLDILPDTSVGHVIVTTRRKEIIRLGQEIHVGGMPKDDSIKLLFTSCGEQLAKLDSQGRDHLFHIEHQTDFHRL